MNDLFRFPEARRRDPAVEAWLAAGSDPLREMARGWFAVIRGCGADIRELMHDGRPTACVGDAAFAYVDAFRTHVNLGFYFGAALADPAGLLEGHGKRMRHVKLRWGQPVNDDALRALITAACGDVRVRLGLPA